MNGSCERGHPGGLNISKPNSITQVTIKLIINKIMVVYVSNIL